MALWLPLQARQRVSDDCVYLSMGVGGLFGAFYGLSQGILLSLVAAGLALVTVVTLRLLRGSWPERAIALRLISLVGLVVLLASPWLPRVSF